MSRSIARHQPVVSAPENQAALYDLLRHLGVTANYVGFSHIGDAVQLCMHSPQRLQLVTKQVYQEVAQRRGTTWKAVERNIRRAGRLIWEGNRPLLEELAGRPLPQKPCSAQLLAILTLWLLREPSGCHRND